MSIDMMTVSEIIPAVDGDRADLVRLLEAAGLPTAGLDEQFPRAYVVAREHEAVVGAAGLELRGTAGLLRSVVVAPGVRKIGVGTRLVLDRLAWAREEGVERVFLLTTTAAPYFERLGFVREDRGSVPASVGNSIEFTSVCPASAVCLSRRL